MTSKRRPTIAIGLDSVDPSVMEKWMAAGYLKNLNQLRQQGSYGQLDNTVNYCDIPVETSSTERLWVMALTGCLPNTTGYWGPVKYDVTNYEVNHETEYSFDYKNHPAFYALGEDYKVAVFDAPVAALSDQVNGPQILGWGGHAPHTPSHSQPPELFDQVVEKYGNNPVLHKDYGCWWDKEYARNIKKNLGISIERRVNICQDLLKQDDWDLFLTVFGDTHSASHDFWHLSQSDHPLYPYMEEERAAGDPMLAAFQKVDSAIGEILQAAPEDANVVVFSVHSMGNNVTDVFSMLFLGEFLYRFNFPGNMMLAPGKPGKRLEAPNTKPQRKTWPGEVWQQKYSRNPIKRLMRRYLPGSVQTKLDNWLNSSERDTIRCPAWTTHSLNWQPAMWYQHLWPEMKAFALPAFAAGHIRINLKGREPGGIVDPADYDALCTELTDKLMQLTDARTGKPVVKEVVKTRKSATDTSPNLPDPDLVVLWHDTPTDVVDSPEHGRIGPVTYYRPGGHRVPGWLMAKGEGIEPGSDLSAGAAIDIGPTILGVMEIPTPEHCDGKPLIEKSTEQTVLSGPTRVNH
ncbi:MAG: alkaline phosphatase family protein [Cyanobacteria bacterium J06598_1]